MAKKEIFGYPTPKAKPKPKPIDATTQLPTTERGGYLKSWQKWIPIAMLGTTLIIGGKSIIDSSRYGNQSQRLPQSISVETPTPNLEIEVSSTRSVGDGIFPTVSPDGKRVAFVKNANDRQILISDSEGNATGPIGHGDHLSWSPDGKYILFSDWNIDHHEVVILATDGSESRVVAEGYNPSWSPDGQSIVYERKTANSDQDEIFITNLEGEEKKIAVGYLPSWSPDGKNITYWRTERSVNNVYTSDLNGHETKVTEGFSPSWSPDGKYIAFNRGRTLNNTQIYLADTSGNIFGPIANGYYPFWSPSGKYIAFQSGSNEICVTDLDGHYVSIGKGDAPISWSQDEKSIAYSSNGEILVSSLKKTK